MHTVVPTVAKKVEGKATVVQWPFMLLEQKTESRSREESESTYTSGSTLAAVVCADGAAADAAEDGAAVVANVEAVEDPGVMRRHYFRRSLNGGGRAEAGVWGICVHVAGGEASCAEELLGGDVCEDVWGRTVPEGLCRDGTV
ncbi:uncharacterized protein MONOS_13722 [Monocercomonoides exilis]|uniref:uncharacterized protein n=1 Tax=Monocercomonoides exilis TaxID=2049356 RepID=UPI00355A2137|nr:hypothetical protein MONOS_13722 [Monocercomonoides exilis]|eukprot:MONOS_13722.1-p1 / transcript=MONOS_13722.1 / gene=MONOS_13722 / organism=Monocercomonoides_exilis_PA203 / gene_product=unspecified product / transcript_product=unspecified product / location=Mono_scaffold00871:16418-16982(-) / protein_length=143 / sequence_SO=supercontig / SO=protein_coding / is_pseudo=false